MRRFVFFGLALLLLTMTTAPVFAWEFEMKGEAEWRYRYWSRTGDVDIFGPMDGSRVYLGINHLKTFPTGFSATGGTTQGIQNGILSGPFFFGVVAGENCYGKEMSFVDYRVTLYPTIKVNPAISLEASLNLTSLGIWSDGQPYKSGRGDLALSINASPGFPAQPGYVNNLYVPISEEQSGVGIPNTYVTLQYCKLGIKTPMLNFGLGYKASAWGLGLWKHACNRPSTSFDVNANYGPFIIGFAPYFARSQYSWNMNGSTSRNEGANSYQRQEQRRNYFLALEGYIVFKSGNLDWGIMSDSYVQQHANRVNPRLAALTATTRPDQDDVRYRVDSYVKYFNGRLFFDAEGAWFGRWRGGRGSADPATNPATHVQRFQDANAFLYALETGVVAGPSKLTLNYVRATGQDPSIRYDMGDAGVAEQGASACFMQDWGLLMYYMYGTGTGWDASGNGQPTDFQHVGGRFDYAVASNLNVFGIYSYAWRDQPTGYTLGGDYAGSARLFTNDDVAQAKGVPGFGAYFGQTAVPDSARQIGWEVDTGFEWQLLENLVWRAKFAYWKPGSWWAFAYPDTAAIYRTNGGAAIVPATVANRPAALTNLGRDIDPFFAVETKLLITF
jgi:hypothetical protein